MPGTTRLGFNCSQVEAQDRLQSLRRPGNGGAMSNEVVQAQLVQHLNPKP